MKTNVKAAVAAIAATIITTAGAIASDLKVVPGNESGQEGPISSCLNVQMSRIITVGLYPRYCHVAASTAGHSEKAQLRFETISVPQGGQVTFSRSVE